MSARWLLYLLGAAALAGALFLAWWVWWPSHATAEVTFPLPPYSESRYLNTGPEAHYVGLGACIECHRDRHASYLLTAHSKALSDLDLEAEPPDASFDHPASGRSYRVYRQDGQMRHEEVLRTAEGKEIARVDLPVRYLIGSGHFSRTYLVEVDGFLHESPITWYASKKKWDVSPGYDMPQHWSFERPAKLDCLVCHVGRVEAAGGSVHRMTIHEKAIGCESCHGPGSQHVALHRAKKHVRGKEDLTIVNPGKLSRPRLEAICAVCHLSGPATVHLRGRTVTSFRPGMPLTDYRTDYRLAGSDQMTVVGHIDQLRQSKCYQKAEDLTCLTCHDPHAGARPKDVTAFYRKKCLSCHTTQPCRLSPAERLKKEPADNCVACHMPRGDTDIPHIAFTHHRIGRHGPRPPPGPQRAPELVPTEDVSHLAPIDQQRNLGLAYMEVARNPVYGQDAEAYRERARALLEAVEAAGLREAETAEALAELTFAKEPARCRAYARQALDAPGAPAEVRAVALLLLAKCEMRDRNFSAAIALLEELVRLRRCSEDWGMLGLCYLGEKKPREALPALKKALAIRPDRHFIHGGLADVYEQLGEARRAKEHLDKARWLFYQRQP